MGIKGKVYAQDIRFLDSKHKKFKNKRKSQIVQENSNQDSSNQSSPVHKHHENHEDKSLSHTPQTPLTPQSNQNEEEEDDIGVAMMRIPRKVTDAETLSNRSSATSMASDRLSIISRTKLTDEDVDEYGFEKSQLSTLGLS